jgi:sulfur-oxidizing protein SoxX
MNKRTEHAIDLVRWPLLLVAALALIGCAEDERAVHGFVLPEGDFAAGEASFVGYGCPICHVTVGTEIEYLDDDVVPRIQLGGEVRKVKSYRDLLTSIVKPNHTLAEEYVKSMPQEDHNTGSSPMPDFKEKLTVADLIDLVEFLNSRYEETAPEYIGRQYVR